MQIGLAQDFIASQLKDTKTHVKRKISFIYLTSLKFTRDSNLSFYLKITLLRNQINLNLLNVAIKTTSRAKFASIVPEKFKNNLTKPVNLQYTIFTWQRSYSPIKHRDYAIRFWKEAPAKNTMATTISTFLLTFPLFPLPLFSIGYRGQPLVVSSVVSTSIDPGTSGRPWCGGGFGFRPKPFS